MCGITNPAQKETLKALCIIQVKIRQALTIDDSKTLKDLTASYSSLAKAAKLDELIESTKTDDITTVAELYQYFEDNGFQFKFYEGKPQDEIDYCIDDIKQCLRQTVLDSTGLSGLLEQMIKREQSQAEAQKTAEAVEKVSVEDLLQLDPDTMGQPEEEADAELTEYNFDDEE